MFCFLTSHCCVIWSATICSGQSGVERGRPVKPSAGSSKRSRARLSRCCASRSTANLIWGCSQVVEGAFWDFPEPGQHLLFATGRDLGEDLSIAGRVPGMDEIPLEMLKALDIVGLSWPMCLCSVGGLGQCLWSGWLGWWFPFSKRGIGWFAPVNGVSHYLAPPGKFTLGCWKGDYCHKQGSSSILGSCSWVVGGWSERWTGGLGQCLWSYRCGIWLL